MANVSSDVNIRKVPTGKIKQIALEALAASGRPPDSDPMVIAAELGFDLLPCAVGTTPELEQTTTSLLAYAAVPEPREHQSRVRLALARGLLLRLGIRSREASRRLARALVAPAPCKNT